jgi:Holliday junction resolvase RusA-like endonuclease
MKLNIKPLSVNEVWQGKRFKTPAYKAYERDVLLILPKLTVPDNGLDVSITFGFSNSQSDIDNPVKPFIDILQKKYGFNDSRIMKMTLIKEKVAKGMEFIQFNISEATN